MPLQGYIIEMDMAVILQEKEFGTFNIPLENEK